MGRSLQRMLVGLSLFSIVAAAAPSAALAANLSPAQPTITEPATDGQLISPGDVHMEQAPFSDPDGGAHLCTDWVIQVAATHEVAWQALCSPILVHIHLGDGTFMNTYAGQTRLHYDTDYLLLARDSDDSGDPATQWSPWAQRLFHTDVASPPGGPIAWTFRQPGFQLDTVASGFQLPVNIAFKPNAGTLPGSPYFYVNELYGNIKVVSRNGTVSAYATGVLDYPPSGIFPGSGEQGLAGLVVEPSTGDLIVSMNYLTTAGALNARVVRFTSNATGSAATGSTTILDIPEPMSASHQISNLTIGPDGKLYVHVGDGFVVSTGENLNLFRGKILRLNLDGSAPTDNPFYDASDGIGAADYIFAYGFRNPFGGVWRPADGKQYEVENGPSVDRFAQVVRGRNYGWNGTDTSMYTGALYNWPTAHAPVNVAFVDASIFGGSGFPVAKMGHAFVAESGPTYATGPQVKGKRISEFVLNAAGALVSGPTTLIEYTGTGKGTVAALAAGPDGLYFSDLYKDLGASAATDAGAKIYRITRDTTAPIVTAPANRFYPSTVVQTATPIYVKMSWTATDPGWIASTQLQRSVNGGAWTNIKLASSTATSWAFRAPSSTTTTYRFRTRATDVSGHVSAWATGPTFHVRLYQQTTAPPTLTFTSAWPTASNTAYYGGTVRYAYATGQTATFKFSGNEFALVTTTGPNLGSLQLILDGVAGPIIDCYKATFAYRQVVGITHFATNGAHTVQVLVRGRRNALSTGTRVDIDAVLTMY
ncbi:MAG: PQQ-dependent sugar dehydrogenase [Candidatus Limnocylindrales bacterium]